MVMGQDGEHGGGGDFEGLDGVWGVYGAGFLVRLMWS